jgi:hypothetical protein
LSPAALHGSFTLCAGDPHLTAGGTDRMRRNPDLLLVIGCMLVAVVILLTMPR